MVITLKTILPFGKYKGRAVKELLPDNLSKDNVKFIKKQVNYFGWLHRETEHTLAEEVLDRLYNILSLYEKPATRLMTSKSSRWSSSNFNSMGSYSGVTFQDCYGDFGY